MKRIIVLPALLLVTAAGVVHGKDKPELPLRSIMACRAVTDPSARLNCYDQAMLTLNQAVQQGQVRSDSEAGPSAFSGAVKASGRQGENIFWVELENGDRWQLLPTTLRSRPPQPGTVLKVRKTAIVSTYWISGRGWSESRARFLRRRY